MLLSYYGHPTLFSLATIHRPFLQLTSAILLFLSLRVLPFLFPEARLWGLDAMRYLDPVVAVVLLVLLLLLVLPAIQRRFVSWTETEVPRMWNIRIWLFMAVLFVLAALFPMSTFFYGDGGSLIAEVYKIGAQENYRSSILLDLKSAPLAGFLLHGLATGIPALMNTLGMTRPQTPLFPFHLLSLFGIIAVYFVVRLRHSMKHSFMDLLLLCGVGSLLLFFGYVETYLTVTVAIGAFLFAGRLALQRKFPVTGVAVLYVLAFFSHYMVLALLPAFLFVVFREKKITQLLAGTTAALFTTWFVSLCLTVLLYWLLGYASSDSRIVLPLFAQTTNAGTQSYTLLSTTHLLDFLNLLLLIGSLPLLFLIVRLFFSRSAKWTAERGFLLLAFLYFVVFLFFTNTSLGLARDWDIAAPLGVMIALLISEELAGDSVTRNATLTTLGFASVIAILPWMLVNLDSDRSARRFETIMQLDDEHVFGDYALSGYEAIRKYYSHERRLDDEARILTRMIDLVGYAEQYRLMVANSRAQFDENKIATLQIQLWMLDRLSKTTDKMILTGKYDSYAINRWQIDSLVAVIAVESVNQSTMKQLFLPVKEFSDRAGLSLGYSILMGAGWYYDGQYSESAEELRAAWESSFRDPVIDGMYGSALSFAGYPDIGDAVFFEASQWHSSQQEFLFWYALTQLEMKRNLGSAKAALKTALSLASDGVSENPMKAMLETLKDVVPEPLPWSVEPR